MIRRELRNLYLHSGTLLATFSFFALALFCVSLAIGPDTTILRRGTPAILWILAILSTLFSTPLLLKAEAKEGLLDEILLRPSPLSYYLLSKITAEFLLFGLPMIALSAFLSLLFCLSSTEAFIFAATLTIGFPALSALGILGALITLQARGGGILLAVLILPLALPLLLLGLSVMEMTRLGLDSFSSFCLLTSVSLVLVVLSVTAGNWALRFAVEE